jgi:hypothetical protein
MIRPVATSEDDRAIYGFTLRGVSVLAAGFGVILAALVLSVIALVGLGQQTEKRILSACRESNQRHYDAYPFVIQIVRKGSRSGLTSEQRAAQVEAVAAIEARRSGRRQPPLSLEARFFLERIDDFVEAIAPHYDCLRRVERLAH